MAIYEDFNKYVYRELFGAENIGQFICLSVDETFINHFCSKKDISLSCYKSAIAEELGKDWSKVMIIEGTDQIPGYLGLLAIQVYAAYLMRKDSLHSERAYNPRMMELLGLNSDYELQSLYRAFQNEVWSLFKDWCSYKGFLVELPKPTTGMRCFIQYPISQALLNQEDCRAVSRFFVKRQVRPFEHFSFNAFCKLIFPVSKGEINKHFDQLYERHLELRTILNLKKQLFAYYNNWDGNGSFHYERINEVFKNTLIDKSSFDPVFKSIVLSDDLMVVRLVDAWDRELRRFDLNDEGLIEGLKDCDVIFPYNYLILFKFDHNYNDWLETRYVSRENKCLLLFDRMKIPSIRMSSYKHMAVREYSTMFYCIFEFDLDRFSDEEIHRFRDFMDNDAAIELFGGLKISRNIYMHGAGPCIKFNKPGMTWINSVRIPDSKFEQDYSCVEFECGRFVVKSEFDTAIYFEVQKPSWKASVNECGWLLSREGGVWDVTESQGNVNGLWYNLAQESCLGSAPIRKWIEVAIGCEKCETGINDPLVVRALKRSRNGE